MTDYQWFNLHATKARVDEVNFWRPSPDATFKVLSAGEPLLFKLHAPRNYIAGGGFFAKFVQLPISLAWDAFGEGNGARTLGEVRARIAKYRSVQMGPHDDPRIGCILLVEPFFFERQDWIPCPPDFTKNTVQGKTYDTGSEIGQALWRNVTLRLATLRARLSDPGPATIAAAESSRYGQPTLVTPRLGQGSFRVLVTDVYQRRCAITGERTLPALEAAHIRPFAEGGPHDLRNGLLLRSDLHRLFDQGYVTVDPDDHRVVVSQRIREEFENGHAYYALHGRAIAHPADPNAVPARDYLLYHSEHLFR